MKRIVTALLAALLCLPAILFGAQNANSPAASPPGAAKKRGPVFRATKEQIKQAQTLLKGRGLYAGEAGGRLDEETRSALRRFQEAEGLKVTGTLNAATLQKMNIPLTDRQKEIVAAQESQKTT